VIDGAGRGAGPKRASPSSRGHLTEDGEIAYAAHRDQTVALCYVWALVERQRGRERHGRGI